ncbi:MULTISPECIES: CCA tRNA nucleotidyltransferase [unclassified Synechococcus]|uniref:CCA tRNA nucleotidyltransferase n=1 Tax=unclassified Synechococcus TaxID=2626047 RepID=UPI001E46F21A|nr:CCA tRNA nucleotidyltransferase [Synechococcus sp. MIT S9509]
MAQQAHAQGSGHLALVGGAVRDALLHHQCREPRRAPVDLDLVLEGSCEDLVSRLQETLGPRRVTNVVVHQQFGTAELQIDGVPIDLAAARIETYPAPGQNPLVQAGALDEDLARRDFTVNAMALVLDPDGSQLLMDPHGGQVDLALRHLAFLHDGSVADDPTRVVRAARYCARLGFCLAPEALSQVAFTLSAWPWSWHLGDPVDAVPPALGTRLRMELDLLLEREPWAEAVVLLQAWSAMPLLDPWLQSEARLIRRLGWASRLGLPAMAALVASASDPIALAQRLQIPLQQQRWLAELLELRSWLLMEVFSHSWAEWDVLQWTRSIEAGRWSVEAVALAVLDNPPCWRPLLRWWGRWRHVASPVSARELMAEGLRPGPELGEALRQGREQVLAGMR